MADLAQQDKALADNLDTVKLVTVDLDQQVKALADNLAAVKLDLINTKEALDKERDARLRQAHQIEALERIVDDLKNARQRHC